MRYTELYGSPALLSLSFVYIFAFFRPTHPRKASSSFIARPGLFFLLLLFPLYFYFILLDSRPLRPIETPLTHRPAASACWNAISRGLTSFPLDAKKSRRARHPIPACIMFSPIHIHLL